MSSNHKVAELAYRLWIERGSPHGSADLDWLEAERQLALPREAARAGGGRDGDVDVSLEASFPASDPAASHTPDVPPSNAEDKWTAAGKTRKTSVKTPAKTPVKTAAGAPGKKTSDKPKAPTKNGGTSASARRATPGDTGEG